MPFSIKNLAVLALLAVCSIPISAQTTATATLKAVTPGRPTLSDPLEETDSAGAKGTRAEVRQANVAAASTGDLPIVAAPDRKGEMISDWVWATDATPSNSFFKTLGTAAELERTADFPAVLPAIKSPAKVPAQIPYGVYIPKDQEVRGTMNYAQMRLAKGVAGTDTIVGLAGSSYYVLISIDEDTGLIRIAPQKVFTDSRYGDIYIWSCRVSDGKLVYDESADITGRMDNNGKITLAGWGLFVAAGENKGGYFSIFPRSEWTPANSDVTLVTNTGATEKYSALIEQPYPNQLNIYNICGYPQPLVASLTSDRRVVITPQLMFTNANFGPFFIYPMEKSGNQYVLDSKGSPVNGTPTDNGFNTGAWAVCARVAPTSYVAKLVDHATISTTLGITYPTPLSGDFKGSGTTSDPYQISSADDMILLAQKTQTNDFKGKNFVVTADIDLSRTSRAWESIGQATAPFNGTFDGAGHTISGLTADGRGNSHTGLFGYNGPSALIKNLTLKDFRITTNGNWLAPAVADNDGIIRNVTVTGLQAISNGDCTGGITARSTGTVEDCTVSGSIGGIGNVAGIVGYNYGKIYRCSADASLERGGHLNDLYRDCAGIAGTSTTQEGYTAEIADCIFRGTINESSGYGLAAGLAGKLNNSTMTRCINTGAIMAKRNDPDYDNYTGGLVAWISSSTLSDCMNAGIIMKTSDRDLSSDAVGGLIGYVRVAYSSTGGGPMTMNGTSKVERCFNTAQVLSSSSEAHKGIWGNTFFYQGQNPIEATFTDCWYDSQISGMDDGEFGRPTSFLTSGTLPAGYSASVWTATQGRYPIPTSLKENPGAKLAAAAILLADGETVNKIKKSFTLSGESDITWKLNDPQSSSYVDETASLRISGSTATIKNSYGNEVISAISSDGRTQRLTRLAIVPKLFDGEGTEASPYLVKNVADFRTIDMAVSQYGQSHTGDYFRMTADIDFSKDPDFQGVGAGLGTSVAFGGNFDGDSHSIHGLKIIAVQEDENGDPIRNTYYTYAGLFNVCNRYSTIRNLSIAADCSFRTYSGGGTVAGYTEGKILNCRNYADIWGHRQYAGGIAGMTYTTTEIADCYNAGRVGIGYSGAAGIVSYNRGKISRCQNAGEIYGAKSSGQELNQSTIGGIAALHSGTMTDCVNLGNVHGSSTVGGLIGQVSTFDNAPGSVASSFNAGVVRMIKEESSRGGVIGVSAGRGQISSSYYDAAVNTFGAANNGALSGITGLPTASLTSGEHLQGLDPKTWQFKAGSYPMLAAFAAEPRSVSLATMYVNFPQGQSRANVNKNIPLSAGNDISWSLKLNQNFSVTPGMLNITVPTGMTMAVDTLVASRGDVKKVFPLKSIPTIFKGEGTADNPYLIESKEDLDKLAEFINITGFDYDGFNFRLVNDLDYQGQTWNMICPGVTRFQATFDGNGKTIKGYTYESESIKAGEGRYIGPFGTVGGSGIIRNLTMAGTFKALSYVGGIAGDVYGLVENCTNRSSVTTKEGGAAGVVARLMNGGVIRGCTHEGTLASGGMVNGGVVASVKENALVENCTNNIAISIQNAGLGGVAGESNGTIRGCRNLKPVTGTSSVGGIVGNLLQYAQEVSDCHNEADITVFNIFNGGTVGGIAARTYVQGNNGGGVTISGCTNSGNITARGTVGGITGDASYGSTVIDCVNTGTISNVSAEAVGGIAGKISGTTAYPTRMERCANHGEIKAHWKYAGGVTGNTFGTETEALTIADCYNDAPVSMTEYQSGMVTQFSDALALGGFSGSIHATVIRCHNAGNVYTDFSGAGGFAGILSQSKIEQCFNTGDVEAKGRFGGNNGRAGGLCGYNISGPVINSFYNTGDIKADTRVGGIDGQVHGEMELNNVYNAGKVTATASGALVSNIASIAGNGTLTVSNSYYSSEGAVEPTPGDRMATPLTLHQLTKADLGDGFVYVNGALPQIQLSETSLHQAYATALAIPTDDDADPASLTSAVWLGNANDVDWTGSDHFVIIRNYACSEKLGEASLTATSRSDSSKSKTFTFNIAKLSGIDGISADKEIATETFYDLEGRIITAPQSGRIYIVRIGYTDGTTSTLKVLVP